MQTVESYYQTSNTCTAPGELYDRETDHGTRCACGFFAHPDSQGDSLCAMCHVAALMSECTVNYDDDQLTQWAAEVRYWEACMAYEHEETAENWTLLISRRNYWLGVA